MSEKADIEKLQEHVDKGIISFEASLGYLKENVQAFDKKHQLSETASGFLNHTIERARSALDELKASAEKLRNSKAAQTPVHIVESALTKVTDSIRSLQEQAVMYDKNFHVSKTVNSSIEGAGSTIGQIKDSISNSLESIVNTAKDQSSEIMNQTRSLVEKIQKSFQSSREEAGAKAAAIAGGVINKVNEYDDYYKVSSKVTDLANTAAGKAKELDEYYGVSKAAVNWDQKVTGGIGTKAVAKGSEILYQGVDYISDKIHEVQDSGVKTVKEQVEDQEILEGKM